MKKITTLTLIMFLFTLVSCDTGFHSVLSSNEESIMRTSNAPDSLTVPNLTTQKVTIEEAKEAYSIIQEVFFTTLEAEMLHMSPEPVPFIATFDNVLIESDIYSSFSGEYIITGNNENGMMVIDINLTISGNGPMNIFCLHTDISDENSLQITINGYDMTDEIKELL